MSSGVSTISEPLFYCPDLAKTDSTARLDGREADHAYGARRLVVGDNVWLFDGYGMVGRATIDSINRQTRTLETTVHERQIWPKPRLNVELACALPKGERQATLLDMATQLGMTAFKPLICERSIVRPRTSAKQRWRRLCIEACKQSRRPYLPLIHDPAPPAEVIDQASAIGYKVWVAHPTGAPLVMGDLPVSIADALLLMVGPEGGFSEHEISQIVAAGAQPVSLGRTILRIETAAIALLAYVTLNAR